MPTLPPAASAAAPAGCRSFGGFGALTRHLGRLTAAVGEALEADMLGARSLALINGYNPGLSGAWMLQVRRGRLAGRHTVGLATALDADHQRALGRCACPVPPRLPCPERPPCMRWRAPARLPLLPTCHRPARRPAQRAMSIPAGAAGYRRDFINRLLAENFKVCGRQSEREGGRGRVGWLGKARVAAAAV